MDFTFAVSWDLINPRRPQTLFAMKYSIDEKTEQVIKGKPTKESDVCCLRVTKGVNMNPPLYFKINNLKQIYEQDKIRISIVNADNYSKPGVGTCNCEKNEPRLGESTPYQFGASEDSCSTVVPKTGLIVFHKLQIKCCSGKKQGHGCNFAIELEFVSPKSPLFGIKVYSPHIVVKSKCPFKNLTSRASKKRKHPEPATTGPLSIVNPREKEFAGGDLQTILEKLNLQKYYHLFESQEIDLGLFLEMEDEDFVNIGISKAGHRLKLRQAIKSFKELIILNRLNEISDSLPSDLLDEDTQPDTPIFLFDNSDL